MAVNDASAVMQPAPAHFGEPSPESMEQWPWMISPAGLADTPTVTNQLGHSTEVEIPTAPLSPFQMPYLTNICLWPGCKSLQKEFLTSQDLDFHIQTYHIRQCPWPTCTLQRSFRRRSDLLRHMESVHSGIRRFACGVPGCDKTYARSDKLTTHKRSHGTARSWVPISSLHIYAHNRKTRCGSLDQSSYSPGHAHQLHAAPGAPGKIGYILAPAGQNSLQILPDRDPTFHGSEEKEGLAPAGRALSAADFCHDCIGVLPGCFRCHSALLPKMALACQECHTSSSVSHGDNYIPEPKGYMFESSN